jgi:SAM-dependent methyltransferase
MQLRVAVKKVTVPDDELPPRLAPKDWMVDKPKLGEWAKKFYAEYVGIMDENELTEHLIEVRRQAWEVYKYRCIASFLFVNYCLRDSYGAEWYDDILKRINGGQQFLDLGCAFGHTARNLVYDGAAQENIISGDLRQEFWDLGYELFRDRNKFKGTFHQGDIFDPDYLSEFDGQIDIVHVSAFFHLFDLDEQKAIVRRLLRLVSSKPGTVIFGRQVGNTIPSYKKHPYRAGQGFYQHNEEGFRAMFDSVANGKWDIQTWLTTRNDEPADNGGFQGRLRFIITQR